MMAGLVDAVECMSVYFFSAPLYLAGSFFCYAVVVAAAAAAAVPVDASDIGNGDHDL